MCEKTQFRYCPSTIDPCIKNLVKRLKSSGYKTIACCCGHGKYPMTIVVDINEFCYREVLSGVTWNKPKKKFYKRNKQGYYYIPEVINEKDIL